MELDSGQVIAWEALARGPVGCPLEFPDRLFGAAARLGRTAEVDHCCRVAAIDGAIAAGLGRGQELFVNVEPDVAGTPVPAFLQHARDRAQALLRGTVEITERALTAEPAELMALVDMYRRRGWGIAIDDVGADPRSIGLMPLLHPDVIKLDMAFVQEPMTRERARVVYAVVAEAERSGASVLAEGIENAQPGALAQTPGATLGQGRHFGHPGEPRPGRDTNSETAAQTTMGTLRGCCPASGGLRLSTRGCRPLAWMPAELGMDDIPHSDGRPGFRHRRRSSRSSGHVGTPAQRRHRRRGLGSGIPKISR